MSTMPFGTERLVGEPLERGHFDEICRMHSDPVVMATLGGMRDEAGSRAYLKFNLAHWRRFGFGIWILRDRAEGRLAGRAVLRHLDVDGVDEVELGYGFYTEWWGRGLATEVARELVRVGFEELSLPTLVAITQPSNLASQRVLQKAGLTHERETMHGVTPVSLFRIRAHSLNS